MGCDIHAMVEGKYRYRSDSESYWISCGRIKMYRDYDLFARLGNVRNYNGIQPFGDCRFSESEESHPLTCEDCVLGARGPGPDLLDAGGLMRLRSYQLLGLLADACEIAMLDGDLKTAMQMSRLAHHAILRVKGEQTLAAAFGFEDPEVEA